MRLLMFKTTDEKLLELGFKKTEEDEYGASYEKIIDKFKYIHCVDIVRKKSGRHIIQSFQKCVNKDGFSNMVGLEYKETKLFLKKMKQLGFNKGSKMNN